MTMIVGRITQLTTTPGPPPPHNLGMTNDWKTDFDVPLALQLCRAMGHRPVEIKEGPCRYIYVCPICNHQWGADSSD